MKRLTLLSIFIIISTALFAQQEGLIPDKQFMLGCNNVDPSEEVTHYISTESEV